MAEILLFGDQTADQQTLLRKIVQRKDHAVVTTFLERAAVAVREEVRKLPRTRRENMPDFLTIGNIVDCLLYTSPSPRDGLLSRMPSSA